MRVAAQLGVEPEEEELGVDVVVARDPLLVAPDLAEERRLEPGLPEVVEGPAVAEHRPRLERRQEVALEIEVAVHVRLGDGQLVEGGERAKAALGDHRDGERRLAAVAALPLADPPAAAVGQAQLERPRRRALAGQLAAVALAQVFDQTGLDQAFLGGAGLIERSGNLGSGCGGGAGQVTHGLSFAITKRRVGSV